MCDFMKSSKNLLLFVFLFAQIFILGCVTLRKSQSLSEDFKEPYVIDNEVNITFMPNKDKSIPYLIYEKNTHFLVPTTNKSKPLVKEFIINTNMRNVEFFARIKKNGKIIKKIDSQKTQSTILGTKKNAWSSNRSKLSIIVPYVAPNEEVVITTRYEWMDIRWFPQVELEEPQYTKNAKLILEVPYGVTMHFQATENKVSKEFLPNSINIEKSQWGDAKQKLGMGIRHEFIYNNKNPYSLIEKSKSDQLSVFLAFETSFPIDTAAFFDSWDKVSGYLYNKIDRFDAYNNDIKNFTLAKAKDITDIKEKVASVFAFLKNHIENRSVDNGFESQEVQTAGRTFQRKTGSCYDIAILGKAMFSSINIPSELVAVGNRQKNPKITFFSPALFNDIVLAVYINNEVYYFDPNQSFDHLNQLPPNLQGQNALVLNPQNGYLFVMPYDIAEKHQIKLDLEFNLNTLNPSDGNFLVSLQGFYADDFKDILNSKSGINITEAQKRLFKEENNILRINSIEQEIVDENKSEIKLRGNFDNFSLIDFKNNTYEFNMKNIWAPFLKSFYDPSFSHLAFVKIKINLPLDYVVESIPQSFNTNEAQRFAQLVVTKEQNSVILELGINLQLPLDKEISDSKEFIENINKPLIIRKPSEESVNPLEPLEPKEDQKENPEEIFEEIEGNNGQNENP